MTLLQRLLALVLLLPLAACKAPDVNSDWMAAHQDKRLGELTLPGSHDAGIFKPFPAVELAHCKGGAFYNIAVTQTWDILGQLKMGARVFDIRPVMAGGKLFTAHGTKENIDALGLELNAGCRGQAIESVFSQVKTFLDAHPTEIVILNIGHVDYQAGMFSDTPAGEVIAAVKASAEERLGTLLFRPQDFPATALTNDVWKMRVSDIVAQNRRAIITTECSYGEVQRGFLGCLPATPGPADVGLAGLRGSWANSPFASTVMSSVENAWRTHLASGNDRGFELSWTTTMDNSCVAGAFSYKLFGVPLSRMPTFMKTLLEKAGISFTGYDHCRSIKTMSQPLLDQLAPTLQRWKETGLLCANKRPRVISMDFIEAANTTEVVRLNDASRYPSGVAGCLSE